MHLKDSYPVPRAIASAALLAAGGLARFVAGNPLLAGRIWMAALIVFGAIIVVRTALGILRGHLAADIVASLAIIAAVWLQQPFAGLVIAIMQTGGEALEHLAEGRASRAVRELEAAAPQTAHRLNGSDLADIPVSGIAPGDTLLVRPGEAIPCDAVVVEGQSHVDTATITGEPIPLTAGPGTALLSGTLNLEGPLTVRATAAAADSQYSKIVELVRTAQAIKAPFQRVADRYAVWFTPVTLAICAIAWLASHDPTRVLAVLVVATPCPLILAAPVAVVAGINRAARLHVIVRNGGALEALSAITTVVFDKTGTLTIGKPHVVGVTAAYGHDAAPVLDQAAAVERGSGHLLARTLVHAAEEAGRPALAADAVVETHGSGVTGLVLGKRVTVGALSYLRETEPAAAAALTALSGPGLRAYIAIDGAAAGVVLYADAVRPGIPALAARLHALGAHRIVMLSGDDAANVATIAQATGIDEARGDLLPADKAAAIIEMEQGGERVAMVGDGTNDAPALAAASVGVALAAGGSAISAEAADAIILGDDPSRIADAIAVGQRTMRIARQSIWWGLGLSGLLMVFAAAGMIVPAIGAMLQEGVDVAVILNALRAAR